MEGHDKTPILTEDPSLLPLVFPFGEQVNKAGREERRIGCETEVWSEVYKMTDTD